MPFILIIHGEVNLYSYWTLYSLYNVYLVQIWSFISSILLSLVTQHRGQFTVGKDLLGQTVNVKWNPTNILFYISLHLPSVNVCLCSCFNWNPFLLILQPHHRTIKQQDFQTTTKNVSLKYLSARIKMGLSHILWIYKQKIPRTNEKNYCPAPALYSIRAQNWCFVMINKKLFILKTKFSIKP